MNTNPGAGQSALLAQSFSAAGIGIGASNLANGNGLAILDGGFHVSNLIVSSGNSIVTRASAYLITGGGPVFTLGFTLTDGDTFYVYNGTLSGASVNGISIPGDSGKVFIQLGGVVRGF